MVTLELGKWLHLSYGSGYIRVREVVTLELRKWLH